VVFVGTDEQIVTAAIKADGTYEAKEVLEGPNRVAIYSINPALAVSADRQGRPKGNPEVDPKLWFPIPDKYFDADKSGLVFTIQRNTDNAVNIELK
jgi:hypothetical protein